MLKTGAEKTKAHERVDQLQDQFLRACQLSRGPVKERNEHWELEARQFKAQLERYIEIRGNELPIRELASYEDSK